MQIEVGKYYRTRNGKKAIVQGQNPWPGGAALEFAGYVQEFGPCSWAADGHYALNAETDEDLVEEWKEEWRIVVSVLRDKITKEVSFEACLRGKYQGFCAVTYELIGEEVITIKEFEHDRPESEVSQIIKTSSRCNSGPSSKLRDLPPELRR